MGRNIVTDEERIKINDPQYLYKCTKCGEYKPNTQYSRNNIRNSGRGRLYVTSCKKCRNEYGKSEKVMLRKKITAPLSRKKNRMSVIYWSSISNSKNRGLEHSITTKYLEELFDIQKGLCYYSNKPMLKNIINSENNDDSVSIDRFDSNKGYIEGNIVLCRWIVNRMKNDVEFSKFIEICSEINKNFN
jgi:hypothetical protein